MYTCDRSTVTDRPTERLFYLQSREGARASPSARYLDLPLTLYPVLLLLYVVVDI